ncbi:MAG TPA: alpha/beta hydrolase family protein [Polyangiaceae bacterium]
MALVDCKFYSEALGMASSLRAILPEVPGTQRPHRTLWLLHGLSDDEAIWTRRTSIERYVEPLGIAVVMPNVHRSFYSNMRHGYRYWDFVSEELPAKARALFPLSAERADNYVAGLSMGGYGAFKLALSKPHLFAGAAGLSSACDLTYMQRKWPEDLRLIFDDLAGVRETGGDLFELAARANASAGPKPRLFQAWGSEDFLHADNQRFHELLARLDFDYTCETGPGDHDWAYWDRTIQSVLSWMNTGTASVEAF